MAGGNAGLYKDNQVESRWPHRSRVSPYIHQEKSLNFVEGLWQQRPTRLLDSLVDVSTGTQAKRL